MFFLIITDFRTLVLYLFCRASPKRISNNIQTKISLRWEIWAKLLNFLNISDLSTNSWNVFNVKICLLLNMKLCWNTLRSSLKNILTQFSWKALDFYLFPSTKVLKFSLVLYNSSSLDVLFSFLSIAYILGLHKDCTMIVKISIISTALVSFNRFAAQVMSVMFILKFKSGCFLFAFLISTPWKAISVRYALFISSWIFLWIVFCFYFLLHLFQSTNLSKFLFLPHTMSLFNQIFSSILQLAWLKEFQVHTSLQALGK